MDAYSNTVRKTIRTDTHFVRQKAFLEHPFRGDDGKAPRPSLSIVHCPFSERGLAAQKSQPKKNSNAWLK